METTSSSLGKTFVLNLLAGGSVLSPIMASSYETYTPINISCCYEESPFAKNEWEDRLTFSGSFVTLEELEKVRIIENFSSTIINESKEIEEDILQIVNKKFWDLL